MNTWIFYLLSFSLIMISRISVSYTSFIGAVISLIGIFTLASMLDNRKMNKKAQYFNLPIFYLVIGIISIFGIANVDVDSLHGFLSFFIHGCTTVSVFILVYFCYDKENKLETERIMRKIKI